MKKPLKYGLGGLALLVILAAGYLYSTQANKALPHYEQSLAMQQKLLQREMLIMSEASALANFAGKM